MLKTNCFTRLLLLSFIAFVFTGCNDSDQPSLSTAPTYQIDALDPNSPPTTTTPHFPVNPGPPATITIGELSDAMPGLPDPSATLKCAVNIRVRDAEGNFAAPGTAVIVLVEPDSLAYIFTPVITINNWGLAELFIFYNSESTFSLIDIIAECWTPTGYIQAVKEDAVLPLYGGTLDLNIMPNSWYFTSTYPGVFKIVATLKDDLLMPISNALIHFDNSWGMFFCTDSAEAAGTLVNNWNLSGNWVDQTLTENDGEAVLFMRCEAFTNYSVTPPYPGIFPDSTFTQTIGMVTVEVVGEEVATDLETVTFRRTP